MQKARVATGRRRRVLVSCLAMAAFVPGVHGDQPQTFPSGVELITVDAVVTDAHGQPVTGLTREDFVLKEDGVAQEILGFQAFELEQRSGAAEARPAAPASNENAEKEAGRAFAVVVDDLGMKSSEAVTARGAISSFLEHSVGDGDLVSVGSASGEVWWSARIPEGREDLRAVVARIHGRGAVDSRSSDYMSDYEAHWIAEHGDSGLDPSQVAVAAGQGQEIGVNGILERVLSRWMEAGLCPEAGGRVMPSCLSNLRQNAQALDSQRQDRTRALLAVVRRSLEALTESRGRKALLLLSPGFLDDTDVNARAALAAARVANAAVYFVDARGLLATTGLPSVADVGTVTSTRSAGQVSMETLQLESAGARTLAEETGGFSVANTNDLPSGLQRISAESRIYYLLGFRAPAGKPMDAWRKLRVEVRRPGLSVRSRRGYTLRLAGADAKSSARAAKTGATALAPAVERALDSAGEVAGVPLRAMTYLREPGGKDTTRVVVATEFDASGLAYQGTGGGRSAHLEVTVAASPRDTGRTVYTSERVEVRAGPGQSAGWRALAREMELPPGVAQVRVVARDPASGALGAVSQRFQVPAAGVLRLATPILSDQVDRGADGRGRPRATLAAHRVFQTDRPLYCELEVFGARAAADGTPRVSAEIAVVAADGTVVRHAPPTRIAAEREGRIVRLAGLDVHDLAPGSYEVVLAVRDEVAGSVVERHEAFAIAPASRAGSSR